MAHKSAGSMVTDRPSGKSCDLAGACRGAVTAWTRGPPAAFAAGGIVLGDGATASTTAEPMRTAVGRASTNLLSMIASFLCASGWAQGLTHWRGHGRDTRDAVAFARSGETTLVRAGEVYWCGRRGLAGGTYHRPRSSRLFRAGAPPPPPPTRSFPSPKH